MNCREMTSKAIFYDHEVFLLDLYLINHCPNLDTKTCVPNLNEKLSNQFLSFGRHYRIPRPPPSSPLGKQSLNQESF